MPMYSETGKSKTSGHHFPFVIVLFFFLSAAIPAKAQRQYAVADVKPSLPSNLRRAVEVGDAYQADLLSSNSRYRLCVSDVVSLKFPHAPEFNQTVSVEPGGFVTLAGAVSMRAEGLTTPELAEAIELEYSKTLPDPAVTVELKEFNRPFFVVLGAVSRPGKYDLRGHTSITQALASAGGLKDTASYAHLLLFRRASNDWYEVKPLDLREFLRGRDLEDDAEVRAGDMVFVPQSLLSKVKRFFP
jgi:polysaccharide export outer membrane protein